MTIISNLLKTLVAVGLVFGTATSFADSNAVTAQKLKIEQMRILHADMLNSKAEINNFSDAMANAVRHNGAIEVVVENSTLIAALSGTSTVGALGAKVAIQLAPEAQASQNLLKGSFLQVALKGSVVTLAISVGVTSAGKYVLKMNESDFNAAKAKFDTASRLLEAQVVNFIESGKELGGQIIDKTLVIEGAPALRSVGGGVINGFPMGDLMK